MMLILTSPTTNGARDKRERHVALDLFGLEVADGGAVVDLALAGDGTPVAKSRASARVVFPAPLCPTRATLRMRDGG